MSQFVKKEQPSEEGGKEEEHNQLIADIFKHEDADKDGFISHSEFSGPKHDEL